MTLASLLLKRREQNNKEKKIEHKKTRKRREAQRKKEIAMAGQQLAKRIPLIKFPVRHRPSAASSKPDHNVTIASPNAKDASTTTGKSLSSEVPASPGNLRSGGKAALQPRRAPISQKEIEAILLGGCF